jgi:Na+/H+ antiporter NhaA
MKIPEWLPDTQHPVRAEHQHRKALIEPWMRPLERFLQIEAASGFVLLACTVLALILANSPWSARFADIWQTRIGFMVGGFELYSLAIF